MLYRYNFASYCYKSKLKMHPLFIIMAYVVAVVAGDDPYDDRKTYGVQALLKNPNLMHSYIKCFLDRGPCLPDARELKQLIPDALATTCSKCKKQQRLWIKHVLKVIWDHEPKAWDKLVVKYGQNHKYDKQFIIWVHQED